MKFADWVNGWWVITVSVAVPAGVTVGVWIVRANIGTLLVAVAWGVVAFLVVLTMMYLVGMSSQHDH